MKALRSYRRVNATARWTNPALLWKWRVGCAHSINPFARRTVICWSMVTLSPYNFCYLVWRYAKSTVCNVFVRDCDAVQAAERHFAHDQFLALAGAVFNAHAVVCQIAQHFHQGNNTIAYGKSRRVWRALHPIDSAAARSMELHSPAPSLTPS